MLGERIAATSAGTLLVWQVLVLALLAGLNGPSEALLSGLPENTGLDYRALPGSPFVPLDDSFVAHVLGLSPGDAQPADSPGPDENGPTLTPADPVSLDGRRTVVRHELTNDDRADAFAIDELPFTGRTNASSATRQPGEPTACALTGSTIWYRYTATEDQGLDANTIGSSGTVTLGVFRDATLETVGCHGGLGSDKQVTFAASAGTTYFFQVTSTLGGGTVVFSLDRLGTTERLSLAATGAELTGDSTSGMLTPDGRWMAFISSAEDHRPSDAGHDLCPGSGGLPAIVEDPTSFAPLSCWSDVWVRDMTTGAVELVSRHTDGTPGNDHSGDFDVAISDDGRFVAFHSLAGNLIDDDGNNWPDVFVRDRLTGETSRVTVSSDGTPGIPPQDAAEYRQRLYCEHGLTLGHSLEAGMCSMDRGVELSADGRWVLYESDLIGLTPDDVDAAGLPETSVNYSGTDVFLHDLATGTTTLVSRSVDGVSGNGRSRSPVMTRDGRFIAFASASSNLVEGDTNETTDIFVVDRDTDVVEIVSVSTGGAAADGPSSYPSISDDGRFVAFGSDASNLVPGDTNGHRDIFVHDRETGTTSRVSVTSEGAQSVASGNVEPTPQELEGEGLFYEGPEVAISPDGRHVAFSTSFALEPMDNDPQANTHSIDVYVHDRLTGFTRLASLSNSGAQADLSAFMPRFTADGQGVLFSSYATNLVPGDTNGQADFVDVGTATNGILLVGGMDVFVHWLEGAT